jgi:heme exporter protein C
VVSGSSPKWFYEISRPWLSWLAINAAGTDCPGRFADATPPDYQQATQFSHYQPHVPAAFLAQSIYQVPAIAGTVNGMSKLADVGCGGECWI